MNDKKVQGGALFWDKNLKGSKMYLFLGFLCGGEVHGVKVGVLECAFGCAKKKKVDQLKSQLPITAASSYLKFDEKGYRPKSGQSSQPPRAQSHG